MGIFSSSTPEDFYEAGKGSRRLTDKEQRELHKKLQGKTSLKGDIKAGLKDLKEGRKGSQAGIRKGDAKNNVPRNKDGSIRSSWW